MTEAPEGDAAMSRGRSLRSLLFLIWLNDAAAVVFYSARSKGWVSALLAAIVFILPLFVDVRPVPVKGSNPLLGDPVRKARIGWRWSRRQIGQRIRRLR